MALVPVVQKLDSANHQINHYQVDRWLGKPITLSTGETFFRWIFYTTLLWKGLNFLAKTLRTQSKMFLHNKQKFFAGNDITSFGTDFRSGRAELELGPKHCRNHQIQGSSACL